MGISLEKAVKKQLGAKYDSYYKLFFFDVRIKGVRGYGFLGKKYACFSYTHDASTIAHETLHCLGLDHTFDYRVPERSFIAYRYTKTNNMLDYSHHVKILRNSLFYWQWKKINQYLIKGKGGSK